MLQIDNELADERHQSQGSTFRKYDNQMLLKIVLHLQLGLHMGKYYPAKLVLELTFYVPNLRLNSHEAMVSSVNNKLLHYCLHLLNN